MDTTDSLIAFDENGVCDHCRNYYENVLPNWEHGSHGAEALAETLKRIRKYGEKKRYDCIIGLSGGLDSSYLAYAAVKLWDLRPKFISVDTHWNMPVADENIARLKKGLSIDVETIEVDWNELKDLQTAYFKSQVPYQDTPQDQAIFAASYNYAAREGVKYFLNGGNLSTECIREPVEWTHYNDIAQLKDIHRLFGENPLIKYPICGMFRKQLYYRYIKGLHIIKPLDWIPYPKSETIKLLGNEFGWEPYQHKHYENRFTRFYEGYWLYHKFGFDKRRAYYSSLIVTEQMSRDEVLRILEAPPYDESEAMRDLDYIADRLDMTRNAFLDLMGQPNKTWKDYKTNRSSIEFAITLARKLGMERRNYR